jgi:hypothetical protein
MTTITTIDPAQNPKVERGVRKFLKALNSGGAKPLETLTPSDARAVLVNAQASVSLELPPCDIEHKTVTQDGLNGGSMRREARFLISVLLTPTWAMSRLSAVRFG